MYLYIASWGNKELLGGVNENPYKLGVYPFGLQTLNTPSREDLINGSSKFKEYAERQANCKFGTGKVNAGGFCGALIMMDGWEIREDYPWK